MNPNIFPAIPFKIPSFPKSKHTPSEQVACQRFLLAHVQFVTCVDFKQAASVRLFSGIRVCNAVQRRKRRRKKKKTPHTTNPQELHAKKLRRCSSVIVLLNSPFHLFLPPSPMGGFTPKRDPTLFCRRSAWKKTKQVHLRRCLYF